MFKRVVLTAVAVAGMSAAAMAADMPVKAPVYKAAPPAFNWSGYYVGLNGGWAHVDTAGFDGVTTVFRNTDGWLLGVTAGRNWQMPGSSFVWGLEGDLAIANVDARAVSATCPTPCGVELRAFGTLRARAGLAANNWLFYVTGGAALGKFDSLVGGIGNDEWLFGWTVGAGVEVALRNRWSLKVEYLFADFEDGSTPTPLPATWDPLEVQVVRAGLNYRW